MLQRTYKYVLEDYLLRNSAILAIGALATGGLNYLFQFFAARILTVEEYGVFGAFAAIFYIVAFSSQAISLFTTKNTVLCRTDAQRSYVLRRSLRVFGGISMIFFGLFILCIPLLQHVLKVQALSLYLYAGLIMAMSLIGAALSGFGRGREDFLHTTGAGILAALLKLVCGIGLVLLGFGVGGAFGGLVAGAFTSAAYLLWCYRKYFRGRQLVPVHISRKEFVWYFFILFFSVLFIDVDMLLVRYYFSAFDAGMYAALSLLGKIVLFVAGATIPVLFPRVVKHIEAGEHRIAARFFWKTFGLTALVGGAMVVLYALFPHIIVGMLYGTKYPIAHLLFYSGLFVLLYVLLSIVLMLAVALRRYQVLWGIILGCIAQVVLVMLFHSSLREVLLVSIGAISFTLVVSVVVLLPFFFEQPAKRKKH